MDVLAADKSYFGQSFGTWSLAAVTSVLGLVLLAKRTAQKQHGEKLPPHIPSSIPFLGHAVSFGSSPVEFLVAAYEKYGPVFSFTMVGKTFTYLIGSDSSKLFFDGKNEDLNAEDVYRKLTMPVFGRKVAYDCPNPVFLEQKKIMKTGLNIARFRTYIPLIQAETEDYFKKWGNSGEQDLFKALSELIILTASRCLLGEEIRSAMDVGVADLFWDLDGGFTQEAWLLPTWFPLPSFWRRDEAHRKIKEIFYKTIAKRRADGEAKEDMLQTFIDSQYKSGEHLTDEEVSGMLIGLLMAGQHTSSTTSSWLGYFLGQHKEIQEQCYEEQLKQFGVDLQAVNYDDLKECTLLDRCLKETLRLRPPIMTMMRMCRTKQVVNGYTIPPGHQVCVSPTTNQRLPDTWAEFDKFIPDRFLDKTGAASDEKFSFIPFGAGRHRCIGESFAYVQIKTIWSTLLRLYEFDLVDGRFPDINYQTLIHTPKNGLIRYKRRTYVS